MFWHMCVLVCIYMYYWYQYVHKQYQQLQYRPIRAEHMQNHNIRVNTYQNTCKYVPNTYQYHRCSPKTRVSNRKKIHTKTYQIRTKTGKYIQKNIPIRVRFDISGGHVAVVLVCIMICICMFPLANTS